MPQDQMGMPPPGGATGQMPKDMHSDSGGRDYGEDNTAEVDIGFFGRDVKPGDTEQVKILSVDEDMGSATIQCITTKPKANSIEEAASKFDSEPASGNPQSQAAGY